MTERADIAKRKDVLERKRLALKKSELELTLQRQEVRKAELEEEITIMEENRRATEKAIEEINKVLN